MGKQFNIIFVGSQEYGARCLDYLIEKKENVQAIFTFDPEEHEHWSNRFYAIAEKNNIQLIKTKNLGKHQELISKLNPDVIFVIGWRTIIPAEVYSIPRQGCVAIHGSLLPKYRGFSPLNWAIINDEKTLGLSMFYIKDGPVDSGEILAQKKIETALEDTMETIKQKFDDSLVGLFKEQFENIKTGNVKPQKQNESFVSYGCVRMPEDGEIDWTNSAKNVYNFIRALGKPYPGAYTHYNGQKIIIWKASLVNDPVTYFGRSGSIIKIEPNTGAVVLTGDRPLLVEKIQPENQEEICAGNYFTSIKTRLGIDYSAEIEKLRVENERLKKILEEKLK